MFELGIKKCLDNEIMTIQLYGGYMKKRDLSKLAALGLLMAASSVNASESSANNSHPATHSILAAGCGGSGGGCGGGSKVSSSQRANRYDREQVADNGCGGKPQSSNYYNDNSQQSQYSQPSSGCAAAQPQQARYQPSSGYDAQPQNYSNQPSSGCGAAAPRPADQGAWNNRNNNNNYRSDSYQADASSPSAAQTQRNYGVNQGTYASSTKNAAVDQDFVNQLNDESKRIYAGLSPEGKDLARQLASQGKEKNAAVKEAQKKALDQRNMMQKH